jgi:hypothetical protein
MPEFPADSGFCGGTPGDTLFVASLADRRSIIKRNVLANENKIWKSINGLVAL